MLLVAVWVYSRARPVEIAFPYNEIRIGVDASNPPFALAEDATLTGLEIDLGYALGETLGLPVRFVNMGYDGLYDSLSADQVDIVISQLLINPLRTGDALYTRPYFDAGLVLLSSKENPLAVMRDLPGERLAYEFGSAADTEVRLWTRRIPVFEMRPYELSQYALDSVRLGEADAALVDALSARLYLRDHPTWRVDYRYVTHSSYAIAVSITRRQTWKTIDQTLAELIENGTLDALLARWL